LVAILFVLFDVEIIFMYPWAVNFMGWIKSSSALAIDMFLEMIVFMGLLLAGFIYVIKKGVLTWEK
jgi:NADH-quinone oxidoreductase subunit A